MSRAALTLHDDVETELFAAFTAVIADELDSKHPSLAIGDEQRIVDVNKAVEHRKPFRKVAEKVQLY